MEFQQDQNDERASTLLSACDQALVTLAE